jgi:hypothetical protein
LSTASEKGEFFVQIVQLRVIKLFAPMDCFLSEPKLSKFVNNMKVVAHLRFLLLLALAGWGGSGISSGQIVRGFSIYPTGQGLTFRWTISTGATCQDLEVQQSFDSLNFETIYVYAGVCGSPTSEQTYYWVHENPVRNQKVCYRLLLGTSSLTAPVCYQFIDYGYGGYILFPNPIVEGSVLHFDNERGEDVTLHIVDYYGNEVKRTILTGNEFLIQPLALSPGYYFFRLEQEDGMIRTGRFVIP